MRWPGVLVLGVASGLRVAVAGAQGLVAARAGVASELSKSTSPASADSLNSRELTTRPRFRALSVAQKRNAAPVLSAVVPGGGQFLLEQNRGMAYLVVEAFAWWRYAVDIRDRASQEARFKDVARRVARAQFSASPPDSDWAYYEQMRDYTESGQYSLASTGPVVPETDPTTFNGSRWLLAESTTPTRTDALAQYARTAVKAEFRWSWRNAQLQYDIFRRDTDKRNDANRAAVYDLLIVGANHVLSMVDAFATMRVQIRAEADGRTSIGARLGW